MSLGHAIQCVVELHYPGYTSPSAQAHMGFWVRVHIRKLHSEIRQTGLDLVKFCSFYVFHVQRQNACCPIEFIC